jgi:hypothetical protein
MSQTAPELLLKTSTLKDCAVQLTQMIIALVLLVHQASTSIKMNTNALIQHGQPSTQVQSLLSSEGARAIRQCARVKVDAMKPTLPMKST